MKFKNEFFKKSSKRWISQWMASPWLPPCLGKQKMGCLHCEVEMRRPHSMTEPLGKGKTAKGRFPSLRLQHIKKGSVIVYGCFISTVRWKYSLFLRFSPWREPRIRHFVGYPFGASRKKASTVFYNTAPKNNQNATFSAAISPIMKPLSKTGKKPVFSLSCSN